MHVSSTIQVAGNQARVFEVFTDLIHAADRITGIKKLEMLTDGPPGVGTRFRETRQMFGREATEEMEVTEFSAPAFYTVESESRGCKYKTRFDFVPCGPNTEVRVDIHTTATGMLAKLIAPLGSLMIGSLKKCIDNDLADLKRFVETGEITPMAG